MYVHKSAKESLDSQIKSYVKNAYVAVNKAKLDQNYQTFQIAI